MRLQRILLAAIMATTAASASISSSNSDLQRNGRIRQVVTWIKYNPVSDWLTGNQARLAYDDILEQNDLKDPEPKTQEFTDAERKMISQVAQIHGSMAAEHAMLDYKISRARM